ncbi:MAG: serine/threonine-protein kinase, partial [Myxococcota bacterium]
RRFIDEARAASAMEHENIIQVLDAGSLDDTRHYIAMEYLEGCTVADRIRRGSIDLRESLTILLETAAGLEVAHEKGIIHRDLKPGNLFLQNSSGREGPTLKILDFGIAKLQKDDLGGGQTKTNTVLGTPHYMSPEQARALPDIDGRTDVYALGLIAYELYAGKRPYEAKSAGDLIFQMSAFTPSTLASICPHVPSVLSEVVQWAMSLEREARPPNVRMLAHALIRATPGGTDVAQAVAPKFLEDFDPHHWEFELRKKPLDRRIVVALLTTLTLGLGSLGVVSFNDWQAEQQLEASIAKEQAAETAEPNESSIESIEKNTAPTTPVPSPQSTLVRVESEPPGARVMIAGVLSGTTPTDVEATIGEPLRIALRLQGYEPFETAVDEVEPDLRISTSLAPLHTRRSGSSNRRRLRGGNRGKTQSTQSSEPSTMSRPPDLEDLFDAR